MSGIKENGRHSSLDRCSHCHEKQPIFVKVLPDGGRSFTFSGSCQNKDCYLYVDPVVTSSWVRVSAEYALQLNRRVLSASRPE